VEKPRKIKMIRVTPRRTMKALFTGEVPGAYKFVPTDRLEIWPGR
jgi:hypothetical protein